MPSILTPLLDLGSFGIAQLSESLRLLTHVGFQFIFDGDAEERQTSGRLMHTYGGLHLPPQDPKSHYCALTGTEL